MRQGQKNNNRSRGRGGGGGGNRRPQNPVNRIFESNGPDVKIRGNAAHVAEKYQTLARDALVSGNTVTAENYFQHAEHYQRILAAAQAYNQQQQQQQQQERAAAAAANDDGGDRDNSDGHGNQNRNDRHGNRGRRDRRNDNRHQNQEAKTEASEASDQPVIVEAQAEAPPAEEAEAPKQEEAATEVSAEGAEQPEVADAKPARKPRKPRKPKEEVAVASEPEAPTPASESDSEELAATA